MAFRTLSTDAQFTTNMALPIFRPAVMVHLDLDDDSPSNQVYATTHHRSVTVGGITWVAVGNVGFVEISEAALEGDSIRGRVGLVGLDMETLQPADEAALIGRPAHIYNAAFDANWENPGLELIASLYIDGAHTKVTPTDEGLAVSYFLNISDRASPSRRLTHNHADGNGAAGDTAQRLMFTVTREMQWPAS